MAFEFNNPLLYELRAGNSDSPYVDKSDLRVIVNNKIVLSELPCEFNGVTIVLSGTAQAGAATTITLTSSASATNDRYNGFTISIVGGTGAGQSRVITDYVGSTKVATVSAWTTNPNSTSVYTIACYNESKINTNLSINSFYVNYLNGVIDFNSSESGQTVLASHKGRGIIQIPVERIYYCNNNGDVVGALQDILDLITSTPSSEITGNLSVAENLNVAGTVDSDIKMKQEKGVIFGDRFKIKYNMSKDSLDFEVN